MNKSDSRFDWSQLFWIFMFCDSLGLALRFGGMEVVDLLFHGGCLFLATLTLAANKRLDRVPPLIYVAFGCLFSVALFQMVPLPDAWLAQLAPVKWRIMQSSLGIFPGLEFSHQITMIPQLHQLKLAVLALDFYAILLLCAAPAPAMRLVRYWLVILTGTLGLLMIWEGSGIINEESPLNMYFGTFGGLINQNHFACFLAMMIVPLIGQSLIQARSVYGLLKVKPTPQNELILKGLSLLMLCATLFISFHAFAYSYSRSGIIDLLLGVSGFFAGLATSRMFKKRPGLLLTVLAMGIVVMLSLPMGKGLEKYLDRGVSSQHRLEFLEMGLKYLSEGQVLGLGLGSTEGVLDQQLAKPMTQIYTVQEYHNDFLQTLVELGPVGLLGLLLFIIWALLEARNRISQRSFSSSVAAATLLGITLTLVFHSMVSFPLRITSIRLTALILLFAFLKDKDSLPRIPRWTLALKLPILLAAMGLLASFLPQALTFDDADSLAEEKSLRYARFSMVPFYQADDMLRVQFQGKPTVEQTLAAIPQIRALVLEHLKGQTYSVKGLNQLFMLEVLEFRLTHEDFDREVFEKFDAKAQVIRDLGGNNNVHAKAARFFLYATYLQVLSPEEQDQFLEQQKALKHVWDPIFYRLKNQ